jgi:hypothetical protein
VLTVVFRTLKREFRVHCPDSATADALAFIEARPEIEGAALVPVDLWIERSHAFLRLSGPKGLLMEGSASEVLDDLYLLRWRAFTDDHPTGALIVGAAVRLQGGHGLLTGLYGAGQSVLATYLAASGFDVATDGAFVLEPGYAAPLPIAMRLSESDVRWLPSGAAEALRRSPSMTDWSGRGYVSVSPAAFGRPWRVAPGPVRHLAVLHANHGGGSRARPLDRDVAFEILLGQTQLPTTGRVHALAGLRSMVNRAQCWDVSVGRLDDVLPMFRAWAALSVHDTGAASGASQ